MLSSISAFFAAVSLCFILYSMIVPGANVTTDYVQLSLGAMILFFGLDKLKKCNYSIAVIALIVAIFIILNFTFGL